MYQQVAEIIRNSRHMVAFTGAGISVESGVAPFRGENGLWENYDPINFEISYFKSNPDKSWRIITEIFYEKFIEARPNAAHYLLSDMEKAGMLKSVITQNIDNLHQMAGSSRVHEFHGNSRQLVCLGCGKIFKVAEIDLNIIPPTCMSCQGLLKPDFVFFGEPIPEKAHSESIRETQKADVMLVIGTTGEIMPASSIPHQAKLNGAMIIEINPEKSSYTDRITDIFLKDSAVKASEDLRRFLLL
jgi:NAD-dependent deacetylase